MGDFQGQQVYLPEGNNNVDVMVYNGYYKVMSNIPKMGHLTTPVTCWTIWGSLKKSPKSFALDVSERLPAGSRWWETAPPWSVKLLCGMVELVTNGSPHLRDSAKNDKNTTI